MLHVAKFSFTAHVNCFRSLFEGSFLIENTQSH